MTEISRRGFLTALTVAGGSLALAGCSDGSSGTSASGRTSSSAKQIVSPYGVHQAGIATNAQDRLVFAAFDVTTTKRAELVSLLRVWSSAIERLASGLQVAENVEGNPKLPPLDTGEALDLPAANLTVTIGFGPSLFDSRFGLAGRRPAALVDLPKFAGDNLTPGISNGDLCVQACADDPQVAFHAVRNLRRLAQGTAVLRWTQLGFGKTSSTSTKQATPRNLLGFKDGTNNIKAEDIGVFDDQVWVGDETDQPWIRGGSYVVTRRIQAFLESWDRDFLADQEAVIGRKKDTGAPLTGKTEFDTVHLDAMGADGEPVIPTDAHIRVASPLSNDGKKLLRRGYSFTDGVDPDSGELAAGLFFIAYQKDPRTHFIPIQRRLSRSDALNEYIEHTSSGIFAVPPGFTKGGWLGESLFA
jgi:deferrochelatase/peroxidase EfeB